MTVHGWPLMGFLDKVQLGTGLVWKVVTSTFKWGLAIGIIGGIGFGAKKVYDGVQSVKEWWDGSKKKDAPAGTEPAAKTAPESAGTPSLPGVPTPASAPKPANILEREIDRAFED